MKKTRIALIVFFIYLLWALPARGEEAVPFDLASSIRTALKNNPSLLQSRYDIKYYVESVGLARAQFSPQLFFRGSITTFESQKEFSPLLTTEGATLITRETSGTDWVAGLTFSQPVFTEGVLFGMNSLSVERERKKLESQEYSEQQLEADTIYNVSESYANVLKTLNSTALETRSLKTSELLLKTAESKYRMELISKVEVLEAQRAMLAHKIKLETLENDLAGYMGALAASMGTETPPAAVSTDKEEFKKTLCAGEGLPPFDQMVKAAYETRSDLKAQEALVQSIASNLGVVQKKNFPQVSLNANYFETGDVEFEDSGHAWNVLARVEVPIFDFGRVKREYNQEQNRFFSQQENLRAMRGNVQKELRGNYEKVRGLRAQIAWLEKNKEQAQAALTLANEKYKRELITELDLMSAQDKLSETELALYNADIDLALATLALKKSAGLNLLECK
jgi:outer membrane protein